VTADARPATGLTKSFLFNWLTEARRKAAKLRPDVSIVSMGANDGYGLTGATGPVMCCGASWSAAYGVLAAKMMQALLRHGAGRVYWVLLAAPQPQPFPALIDAVNAGIRQAAARFPGHVGLIDANAFFTPGDQYRDTMTYNGQTFTIHETDGVHLSPAADTVLAQLIEQRLIADRVIRGSAAPIIRVCLAANSGADLFALVILQVQGDVLRPLVRQLVLGEAGVDRARLDAGIAVDALLRVDVEHLDLVVVGLIRRRMDAVDRTDLDARVVLGTDARLGDDVGHGFSVLPSRIRGYRYGGAVILM
jgi:lysophospholipase L1-like esterase